jgi:hypothetical protein
MRRLHRQVRFVPIPELAALFDYFVSAREQRGRHFEAERSGGLKVDHQFVLGRRLHRQVGWLFPLEDAVNIASRATVLVGRIGPLR